MTCKILSHLSKICRMKMSSEAPPQTDECELVILSERRISLHQLRNEMLRFAQHDMQNLVSFVKDLSYEDV